MFISPPVHGEGTLPIFLLLFLLSVLKFRDYQCGSFFINFAVKSVGLLSIWKFFTPMKVYLYYFFDNCFSFIFYIFCLNSGYSHVGPPGLILNFPHLTYFHLLSFGLFSKIFPKFNLTTFLDFSDSLWFLNILYCGFLFYGYDILTLRGYFYIYGIILLLASLFPEILSYLFVLFHT